MPHPLGAQVVDHPDFPRQVSLAWHALLRDNPEASALCRLQLLKKAMRTAESALSMQLGAAPLAEQLEDRIGVSMKFLRASEASCPERVSRCLARYPLLQDLVANPYDFITPPGPRLMRVRRHVMDLQKEYTMKELQGLHEDLKTLEPDQVARRWATNQRLICKLAPGRSCQQFAMDSPSGVVTSDPQEMVRLLRAHWSQVFTAKEVDMDLMRKTHSDKVRS